MSPPRYWTCAFFFVLLSSCFVVVVEGPFVHAPSFPPSLLYALYLLDSKTTFCYFNDVVSQVTPSTLHHTKHTRCNMAKKTDERIQNEELHAQTIVYFNTQRYGIVRTAQTTAAVGSNRERETNQSRFTTPNVGSLLTVSFSVTMLWMCVWLPEHFMFLQRMPILLHTILTHSYYYHNIKTPPCVHFAVLIKFESNTFLCCLHTHIR